MSEPSEAPPAPTANALSAGTDAPIQKALAAAPAARPDVVARGKQLVSDPTYPPLVIIDRLAKLFVADAGNSTGTGAGN